MSDFFHNGEITTLHILKEDNIEYLDDKLRKYAKKNPNKRNDIPKRTPNTNIKLKKPNAIVA